METTITVRYLNAPKPGKTRWTVKDSDGVLYGLGPGVRMEEKQTYAIVYEEKEFRGTMYKTITKADRAATPAQEAGGYGKTDDATAERIFVCGAINASLSNPTINPAELAPTQAESMVRMWRAVWASTFGDKKPSVGEEMSDEIPY